MAAEASRSSTGPADSYIGSLISLTSKSEIRYEGVLFTINTEEASIGLRNVRSFGTEGRRKDGPQVPPIDKVYEYIVFRGSDIKDLQVKSSPPPQTSSIHNDPAIIQSQYSQAAASTSLPHVSNAAVSDVSTRMLQSGPPRSPFQSSLPLYQPGGSVPSWGSSAALPSGSGPMMMPMYQHGFYGASSNLQNQQPPMFQPPQSFPMPSPVQQPVHNSILNASMQAGLPVSQPMLLQPPGSEGFTVLPSMIPGQSMAVPAVTATSLLPAKTLPQVPLPMSQGLSLPLVSPVSHALDVKAVNTISNPTKPVSSPMTSYSGMPEPVSAAVGPSISPILVTPGQFVQPGLAPLSASQPLQTAHKDVEVVQVSSSVQMQPPAVSASASASPDVPKSTESQAPLLPLPSPANREFDRAPSHNHYMHRGGRRGRGRGRGSELSNSETRFTGDFDFEAMNEKFNKDEVWGHLGKSKDKDDDNEDSQYDDNNVESPQFESKPVYNKDDFFDSLSSNSLDNGSRNGRPRFSEQRRLDSETFGEFSKYRGGRGGRGPGYGRNQRGGYYGRGYGYSGRGRGGSYNNYNNNNVYRAT